MRISDISQKGFALTYQVYNEQDFEVLMLCESQNTRRACTFVDTEKYVDKIPENVVMVITNQDRKAHFLREGRGVIVTDTPRLFYFKLHNYLCGFPDYRGAQKSSQISSSAVISPLAMVSEWNVEIGENVTIEPFVIVHPNVKIGEGSVIRSGAAIGGSGFEYKREPEGILPVTHVGSVNIGRYVEIHDHTCVDKALYPWDSTVIGDHTKIDKNVYIAHGVKIGSCVMVAANAAIAGRVQIRKNAWIGLGACIRNGVTIGCGARANMGAVVTKDVFDHESVTGNFAMEHSKFLEKMRKSE